MHQSHDNTESGSGKTTPDSPEFESDLTPLFPNDGMNKRFLDFDNLEKNGEHKLMEDLLKQIFLKSNRRIDNLHDRDTPSSDDNNDDYSDEDGDPITVFQPGDSFGPFLGSVDINLGKIGGIGILRLSETKEGPQDEPVRNPRFAMECHQRPYAWAHRYERGYRQG